MRALTKAVVDVIWAAVEPLLPRAPDRHPLGCHRPRGCDRLCLQGIVWRLVLGCSWVSVEILLECRVSDTTLRRCSVSSIWDVFRFWGLSVA
ncbi:MAG: transposase, partial [Acidimicrobiales bacterium]|nr:transposase [Acidimicrobiales bacterium]